MNERGEERREEKRERTSERTLFVDGEEFEKAGSSAICHSAFMELSDI